jgi:hypothetical protein
MRPIHTRLTVLVALWAVAGCGSNDPSVGDDSSAAAQDGSGGGSDGSFGGNSGTEEICNDQLDNNGNGLVDEGCPCKAGATQACYTGPAGTRNKGVCQDGVENCAGNGASNYTWSGQCAGAVNPGPAKANGKDNDCDGRVDVLAGSGGSGGGPGGAGQGGAAGSGGSAGSGQTGGTGGSGGSAGTGSEHEYDETTPENMKDFRFFQKDTFWHANITALPKHPRSDEWIAAIAHNAAISDSSSKLAYCYISAPHRINVVNNSTPMHKMGTWLPEPKDPTYYTPDDVDYPLTNHSVQSCQDTAAPHYTDSTGKTIYTGGEIAMWIVNPDAGTWYEFYAVYPTTTLWPGTDVYQWKAKNGRAFSSTDSVFKLKPNGKAAAATGSVSGIIQLPGFLLKRDLTQPGEIDHALYGMVWYTINEKLWPAQYVGTGPSYGGKVPTGTWLRLQPSFNIEGFTANTYAQKLLRAMKTHGIIILENTGSKHGEFGIWGETGVTSIVGYSSLTPASELNIEHFEVVDGSQMMPDKNDEHSLRIKPEYATP